MRFTYITETIGNQPVTTIQETAGVFSGYTTEQVAAIAEDFYPNYQSNNMSNIFSDIHFNYCLRKLLNGEKLPNTHVSSKIKQRLNEINELDE